MNKYLILDSVFNRYRFLPTVGDDCEMLAVSFCNYKDKQFISKKSFYVKPVHKISSSVFINSGINEDVIDNGEHINEAELAKYASRLFDTCTNKEIYLIGWNILESSMPFLEHIIKKHINVEYKLPELKIIDLKKISVISYPEDDIGSYSIESVYNYCFPKKYVEKKECAKHLSGKDILDYHCELLDEIAKELISKMKIDSLDELYKFQFKPHILRTMPFGKYTGVKFDEIMIKDIGYMQWLLKCNDVKDKHPDVIYTVKSLLSSDFS